VCASAAAAALLLLPRQFPESPPKNRNASAVADAFRDPKH
jgi:hypothetical protein